MMIIPGWLNFSEAAANNNYIIGPLVITFAYTSIWEINRSARYANVALGSWLILAPFVLEFDTTALWTDVLDGTLIILLSLLPRRVEGTYGGGWQSLFQKSPPHLKGLKKNEI